MDTLKEQGEKEQWMASRNAIAVIVNAQVDDYLNKFRDLSEIDCSNSSEEQIKESKQHCQDVLKNLMDKILESAELELRVGWAISIFQYLRTAGFAGASSID